MRVLITGGAGFIGSHLVDYLIAKNSQILVLDNFSGLSDGNLNGQKFSSDLDIVQGSILDEPFQSLN